jgi:hypothetical protein
MIKWYEKLLYILFTNYYYTLLYFLPKPGFLLGLKFTDVETVMPQVELEGGGFPA